MLSIILLSYNSGNRIITSYEKLKVIMDNNNIPFELIVADDGSVDDSFEIARNLALEKEEVLAIKLSKNYTSHYAAFAALTVANGDCVTIIPDDEQQPYSSLVEMHKLWQHGERIILPYRKVRADKWHHKLLSRLFYLTMNGFSDIELPKFGIDTWFIDRSIVEILNKEISPRATTTITEIIRLGFNPIYLPYERPQGLNQGKSRWTFRKKLKLASDIFYSTSTFPIRLIMRIGMLSFTISVLLGMYYLGMYVLELSRAPLGWTTLILAIVFFSGIILLSLGIIARYIHLIYIEVKARPGFIISDKV